MAEAWTPSGLTSVKVVVCPTVTGLGGAVSGRLAGPEGVAVCGGYAQVVIRVAGGGCVGVGGGVGDWCPACSGRWSVPISS